jgi:hypothetical protein
LHVTDFRVAYLPFLSSHSLGLLRPVYSNSQPVLSYLCIRLRQCCDDTRITL